MALNVFDSVLLSFVYALITWVCFYSIKKLHWLLKIVPIIFLTSVIGHSPSFGARIMIISFLIMVARELYIKNNCYFLYEIFSNATDFLKNKKNKRKEEENFNSERKSNNENIKEELSQAKERLKKVREEADHQKANHQKAASKPPRERLNIFSEPLTHAELKKAYRLASLKCHPDHVEHLSETLKETANEEFKKLNEAYNKLKKVAQ
ncbi:J domain-containing protein [Desulfotalea psychrophila]|uniref:Related to chaperone protein DnaJ (Partial length) n=1 Tax=Desulfotalea psychrophila (strain LSv54 / DSM 12343) TaxID=177439 RepID=Q6AI68_DESPS|nr:J domain-containing protein [Desulfotalea psychrophila]CAG37861.1 related to chaperone protein DnaJ (partial length) [Desulfotalea psychrophila LSv54]